MADQTAQNASLSNWAVELPIPKYRTLYRFRKHEPKSEIFELLARLKNGHGPQGVPCEPSRNSIRTGLARFTIHDRLLLAHHFIGQLKSKEVMTKWALASDYGMSPTSLRTICEMVKLAPEIQDGINRMSEEEASARVRFRELFLISQIQSHEEQQRRFAAMIEIPRATAVRG